MRNLSKQFDFLFQKSGSSTGTHEVTAYSADDDFEMPIGSLKWKADSGEIDNVKVDPEYRRQGVATGMFKTAKKQGVVTPKHSVVRTEEGDSWAKSVGGKVPKKRIEPANTGEE